MCGVVFGRWAWEGMKCVETLSEARVVRESLAMLMVRGRGV